MLPGTGKSKDLRTPVAAAIDYLHLARLPAGT